MKYITFIAAVVFAASSVLAQSDKEKVTATIQKSTIEGHIYFLADDLLKGRETGTAENKIAASYLANTLRGYGVLPNPKTGTYYQQVKLKKTSPPDRLLFTINGKEYKKKVILNSTKMRFNDKGIYLGYGLANDYEGKDVTKKMVIIKGGSPDGQDVRSAFRLRSEKKKLAIQAGARGIIEFIDTGSETWEYIDHNFNGPRISLDSPEEKINSKNSISYLWVQDEEGHFGRDIAAQDDLEVNLAMKEELVEMIDSQNVIGIVEGTDPQLKNEYIIYSAHYDHVGIGSPDETGDTIYNGARDNAIGTTTVLSMAQNLARYPTKRSALFILFTGEEKGLLGSKYYVDNPVLPLNQMVYCFNSDNGGYNDTSLATIVGLSRTSAEQNIKDAAAAFGLKAIDDPAPEQGLFDRSDNVHFAAKGIPAPTFSLGFTAFNGEVTKYYHQPGDEANNLDYDYLFKFFQAYVLAGRNIANDPKTPFWTPGDKYEEIGKQLYNR